MKSHLRCDAIDFFQYMLVNLIITLFFSAQWVDIGIYWRGGYQENTLTWDLNSISSLDRNPLTYTLGYPNFTFFSLIFDFLLWLHNVEYLELGCKHYNGADMALYLKQNLVATQPNASECKNIHNCTLISVYCLFYHCEKIVNSPVPLPEKDALHNIQRHCWVKKFFK